MKNEDMDIRELEMNLLEAAQGEEKRDAAGGFGRYISGAACFLHTYWRMKIHFSKKQYTLKWKLIIIRTNFFRKGE